MVKGYGLVFDHLPILGVGIEFLDLTAIDIGKVLLDRLSSERVDETWCKICQWDEHEGSLVHSRMRDGQLSMVDLPIGVKKDVDIDLARTPAESGRAPHPFLDPLEESQQCPGSEPGFGFDHLVEKFSLLGVSPWRC